ncbi:Integrase family protein [uncultured Woeseiaceae bacterium]|uniref:Integrase family protein n=1 Tax=uncultured Woeseiaceae bacterium TaxID=1983305 RepID=A0A7D9H3V1_9GAMM|nr:Integrase family protein [uncultured Woeseiaceae bacterium]
MQGKLTARLIASLLPRDAPFEIVDTEIKGFLLRVQPSGWMTYYFSYRTQGGRRARRRIGRHGSVSPAQARDEARRLSAKVIGGEDVQASKKRERLEAERAKFQTLAGFLEYKYEPWVIQERKTGAATVGRIKSSFDHLLSRPIGEISPWDLHKWRVEQLRLGKAKSTLNRDVAALRACLAQAVDWQLLDRHPLKGLKPLKIDKLARVRFLSPDEETRLRAALQGREVQIRKKRESANRWRTARGISEKADLTNVGYADYLQPMILLAMNTGVRYGELTQLEWADVDFQGRTIRIRGDLTKSGTTRYVPVNDEAQAVLSTWKIQNEKEGLIFAHPDGGRLKSVRKAWTMLLKLAKIIDFRWHDLRHHFASKLVMRNVNLNTVRELLGHADLDMTLRYAHLSPDHKAEAVARLDADQASAAGQNENTVAEVHV